MLFTAVTYTPHVKCQMYFKVKLILLHGCVNICDVTGDYPTSLIKLTLNQATAHHPISRQARGFWSGVMTRDIA